MVGWMRVNCTRVEYVGLIGDRWQTLEIPHDDAVHLAEPPIGLHYLAGADDGYRDR